MSEEDLAITVDTKIMDGWIDDGIEYALVKITVGNMPSELYLFTLEDE